MATKLYKFDFSVRLAVEATDKKDATRELMALWAQVRDELPTGASCFPQTPVDVQRAAYQA